MTESRQGQHRFSAVIVGVVLVGFCVCLQTIAAQEQPATGVFPIPQPAATSILAPHLLAESRTDAAARIELSMSVGQNAVAQPTSLVNGSGPRRITLDEAQQQAAITANPILQFAKLGVEAAKQHRLGVQSDFLPKISTTFANLHFNKLLGQLVQFRRPILGTTTTFAVPVFNRDQTMVGTNVMQPLTPLFKLRQVLQIARADERIARGKAGLPLSEVASNVEQAYFGLLIAQRQRQAAEANFTKIENKSRVASSSVIPAGQAERDLDWIEGSKALVVAASKGKEACAALNALLGWPLDTQLELLVPAVFYENISAAEATELAMQNNPEVIEAEQTAVKAKAAGKLAKLDYVPDVAIIGGYAYQTMMPSLPNDFSYVGVMGNYTLFDFGKRERTVKERNAQLAMAETGLTLVKAKVAASVTKAYYELDRSRQLANLARRMNSANRAVEVKYEPEEAKAARASSEADMLQAELEYRRAFSRLQQLIGNSR